MRTIVYQTDSSPPARAVKMILYILGLEFEIREMNPLLREQDAPEMRKYGNPEHEYLYPKDMRKRATVNQRLFFDCGILFQRLRSIMAPTYMGIMTEMPKEVILGIKNAYRMLEEYLSQSTYLADENMTIADVCAVATVSSLDGMYPVEEKRYPKTRRWLDTMYNKDFCRIANQPGCELHVAHLKFAMENNKLNRKAKL
ncbi:unnamed protein product [Chilo suppressalis]|uniref:GST C-terminal domain-containing protein n=1 Tax=Chilo suppressalis TaxID=168631 RepID=A0ABN8B0V6_CHISP|nr:unnamed protein product [Chilo suppressalis]